MTIEALAAIVPQAQVTAADVTGLESPAEGVPAFVGRMATAEEAAATPLAQL